MGFELKVLDVFLIQGVGTVVLGEWNKAGVIRVGEVMYTFENNTYYVSAIYYKPVVNEAKIGLLLKGDVEITGSLIGQSILKQ